MRVWFAAAVLLLLMPSAGAQEAAGPTPTTLYFHVIDGQDMPINTQEPAAAYEETENVGPITMTAPCLAQDYTPNGFDQRFHTWYGYATPTFVEYDAPTASGTPRTHPERGVAYDIRLDDTQPFTLYWYAVVGVAVQDINTVVPLAAPQVRVSATMRQGDFISVDDSSYNEGALLAQGNVAAATLAGDRVIGGGDGQVRAVGQRDGGWLYEFAIPMAIVDPVIPVMTGYNVRIDLVIADGACDGLSTAVARHTSFGARPRMVFTADDRPLVQNADHDWDGSDVVVEAGIITSWGSYDVNPATLRATVTGPMTFDLPLESVERPYHSHTLSDNPMRAVWRWGNASLAPPGHYDIQVTASDLQGTGAATMTFALDIAPAQESPGLGAPVFLTALAALAVAWRRRG